MKNIRLKIYRCAVKKLMEYMCYEKEFLNYWRAKC